MGVDSWSEITAFLQKARSCACLDYVNPPFSFKVQFKAVRKTVWYQFYAVKCEATSASDFVFKKTQVKQIYCVYSVIPLLSWRRD